MRTFLVESYLTATRANEMDEAIARLSAAAASVSTSGVGVRYLHSTYVPEDEICFHVFEADSADAVQELGTRAAVTFDRIVEARDEPNAPLPR